MMWSPVVLLATVGLIVLAVVPFVVSGVLEVLLALSLALLSTAFAVQLGWLAGNWPLLLAVIALLTVTFAGLLWRPLRHLMRKPTGTTDVSDFIGVELQLPADFDASLQATVFYSGIRWQVRAESADLQLLPSQRVVVCKVEVGVLSVRPVDHLQ